jgi:4-hydroxy-2-oxoheptanedioate aldolase
MFSFRSAVVNGVSAVDRRRQPAVLVWRLMGLWRICKRAAKEIAMLKNAALAKWRAGEQTIGGWLQLANTHSAEVMARAGFDWLVVDLQHGLIGLDDLRHMLPAISTTATTPIVRVSGNDPKEIMKALDTGAQGVIVPLVNNRAEAEAAVAACLYPPLGSRSYGPIRAGLIGGPTYAAQANGEVACIVMIETREGIDNLDDIVATPGLTGVYIGPSDLALALGMPPVGDTEQPEHLAVVSAILAACKRHGVAAGIHTMGLDYTKKRLAAGFDFVTLGGDVGFMARAANVDLKAAREALSR